MNTLLITGIALVLLAFSSCKRECTVCSKTGEANVEYCSKEFDSPSGYHSAIEMREGWGYTCQQEM